MQKRSKQQIDSFNAWKPGGRGRPPIGKEYKYKKRNKDKHFIAVKKDVCEICYCIENLAGLAGIHKIDMARIIGLGIDHVGNIEKMMGIVEFKKSIKRMTGG
jgi:hypothetical protein